MQHIQTKYFWADMLLKEYFYNTISPFSQEVNAC